MIETKTVREYLQEYNFTKEQFALLKKLRYKVDAVEKELNSLQRLGLTEEESRFLHEDNMDGFVAILEEAVKEFKGILPEGLISAAIQFNLDEDIFFLDESFKITD